MGDISPAGIFLVGTRCPGQSPGADSSHPKNTLNLAYSAREKVGFLSVHLVNPSDNSFGTAVITPRWLFVLAAATPRIAGDPFLVDESIEQIVPESIQAGDIVGISVHTGNALRGYEVGRIARERGAWVVYGGIHATLFPEEAFERGQAHAVVKGDGDIAWGKVVADCLAGDSQQEFTKADASAEPNSLPPAGTSCPVTSTCGPPSRPFAAARSTAPSAASGGPMGKSPASAPSEAVIDEIVNLRQIGFRFIALADDNFYPVTLTDLRLAREQNNLAKLDELTAIRAERFLSWLSSPSSPGHGLLHADHHGSRRRRRISRRHAQGQHQRRVRRRRSRHPRRPEGRLQGLQLLRRCACQRNYRPSRSTACTSSGPSSLVCRRTSPRTFDATVDMALKAGVTFAQFVMMTPFPGTVDFDRWEKEQAVAPEMVGDIPITRYWLIPTAIRPKMFTPHPSMSSGEIASARKRSGIASTTGPPSGSAQPAPQPFAPESPSCSSRSSTARCTPAPASRPTARAARSRRVGPLDREQCRKLFAANPMPELQSPAWDSAQSPGGIRRPVFLNLGATSSPFSL